MVSKKLKISLLFWVLLFSKAVCAQIDFKDFSLVVAGNQTEMNNMSTATVRDYFKGKNYKWPNKKNVIIVLPKHPKVELYSISCITGHFLLLKSIGIHLFFKADTTTVLFWFR